MKSDPLTDAELDQLNAILKRLGNDDAMNLEQLDGFFAALICGPELVPPSKYLPKICGTPTFFEDASSAQEFFSLIMRHWNAVADTLNSGEVYLPLLLEDESGVALGNDWANGFLRGMEFGKEDWVLLLDDEDHGGSLIPILALANEHNPDPEMRPYKDPIGTELRETLIVRAAAGTTQIYRYFNAQRFLANDPLGNMLTSSAQCRRLDGTIRVHADRVKTSSSAVARLRCIRSNEFGEKIMKGTIDGYVRCGIIHVGTHLKFDVVNETRQMTVLTVAVHDGPLHIALSRTDADSLQQKLELFMKDWPEGTY
jgi:uncharacterized protein